MHCLENVRFRNINPEVDKTWYRSVIKYLQKKCLAFDDIHANMVAVLGDDAPTLLTVQKWATEFKRQRESVEDDPKSGRPATATSEESNGRVHPIAMDDRGLTINQFASAIRISLDRPENILHNTFGVTKILLAYNIYITEYLESILHEAITNNLLDTIIEIIHLKP
ncbi:uncharacterized protein LOC115232378 [Octopus sinensis]|uniref:Uncharacterized protein LOC115232378 n=1 Tax=Octopus sinensis TaxID=2607531 RepID=A0A6P7U0B3_9MOLL|nr:uncharacterized protein LOC115232378 [Octopus sinensis]